MCLFILIVFIYRGTDFHAVGPLVYDPLLPRHLMNKALFNVNYKELALSSTIIDSKVERIQCNFYRVYVSEEMLRNGFIIQCKSLNRDKFKCILFNSEADIIVCENSHRSRDKLNTNVTMFFNTEYEVYTVRENNTGIFTVKDVSSTNTNVTTKSTSINNVEYVEVNANTNIATDNTATAVGDSTASTKPAVSHPVPPIFERIESIDNARKQLSTSGYYLFGKPHVH